MSIALVNSWLGAFAFAISIANALWVWLSRPARDTNKRIDKTEEMVSDLSAEANNRADRHREELKMHDRRIQRIEDDLRHLPTKDDLTAVGNKLTGVKTELDIVARTVTRIDDFLRKPQ